MKSYRLTKAGKASTRVPAPDRSGILDYLYEHKTAVLEELLVVDRQAKGNLKSYIRQGLVEEIDGSSW